MDVEPDSNVNKLNLQNVVIADMEKRPMDIRSQDKSKKAFILYAFVIRTDIFGLFKKNV